MIKAASEEDKKLKEEDRYPCDDGTFADCACDAATQWDVGHGGCVAKDTRRFTLQTCRCGGVKVKF